MPFPSTLPSYQFGIDAASTYTDAGTTLCTANGNAIQQATDLSGNGRHASQATSSNRPDFVLVAGKPVIRFDNRSSNRKLVTPSFLDSSYDTSLTLYMVWESHGKAGLTLAAAANGTNLFLGQETNALQPRIDCYTNGAGGRYLNFDSVNRMVVAVRYNGTTKRMRMVGEGVDVNMSSAMTAPLGLTGPLTIGDLASGGFAWRGFICAAHLYNAAHSDADCQAMISHLSGLYLGEPSPTTGTTGAGARKVVCDGNSLTIGQGATASYPTQLASLLGVGWSVSNLGVGSQTTGDMLLDAETQVDALYDATAAQNCVIAWEGTNNMYFGLTAGQSARQMRDYILRRKYKGFQSVYAMTALSRSDTSTPGTFNTSRAAYNATLAANHGGTDCIRLDQDARIGDDGDELNSPPFSTDKVHMLDAGYAIVAGDAYDVITDLQSSSSSVSSASSNSSSSSSTSSTSRSSASSASSNSSSSSSSTSSTSRSSGSSASSGSSSASSDPADDPFSESSSNDDQEPFLTSVQRHNDTPIVAVSGHDLGPISAIDELVDRYTLVKTFRGPVTVDIESPFANSEIRYTLNGKNPTPTSRLYTGQLVFRQNATGEKTTVKARVYDKKNANRKSRIIRLEFRVIPPR